ncbi:asparaginase [Thermopolyspora sp. NPDC052614]|uniref:asparaginase n=1 Tax=Thermopolyspora sp. NPDC052614 TaxID=3155682 RepID=UPI0034494CDF
MPVEPLIVEVVRSGFVESVHRARVLAVADGGEPVRAHGEVAVPVSPRSTMKPLQAVGMLRAGLDLDDRSLALACASHAGEPFHVDGVRKILADAGLGESALQCPPALPESQDAAHELIRSGREPGRVHMDCSGKHAAMLATCVVNGWPIADYRHPTHPLQRAIRRTVDELTGERAVATGVDGCGAPLFFVSMVGVVRAYRALVAAPPGSPERRVADAMRAHPEWTSGTTRFENILMRALPGLLAKAGAEAFFAFVHEDGRAGAVKIEDGARRARLPVVVAALRALGLDAPELIPFTATPVLGAGEPVGEIRVRGA